MALEQSLNCDSKKGGGIIGITQQPGALNKWFLTSPDRAAITTATKIMCGLEENAPVGLHKECGSNRIKRDEADIQKLLSMFKSKLMTNMFELPHGSESECVQLVNIASGVVVPTEMVQSLVHAKDIGREKMDTFIQDRMDSNTKSFWDAIPQLKLKTFANLAQKKIVRAKDEKAQMINADRELFGRLIIAAKSRDVDLKSVFAYELSAVPFSLVHSDGTLRKTNKSVLLAELEKEAEVHARLPTPAMPLSTVYIVDCMATIQMVKSGGAATFGELANKYWEILTAPLNQVDCNRVDIIFDRYDRQESIKLQEHDRRGASTALEINIAGGNTPLPKQWAKYISNPVNKANLTAFLSEQWCNTGPETLHEGKTVVVAGGSKDGMDVFSISATQVYCVIELRSDHEEADTRMVLQHSVAPKITQG